jgi:hypothetical protein
MAGGALGGRLEAVCELLPLSFGLPNLLALLSDVVAELNVDDQSGGLPPVCMTVLYRANLGQIQAVLNTSCDQFIATNPGVRSTLNSVSRARRCPRAVQQSPRSCPSSSAFWRNGKPRSTSAATWLHHESSRYNRRSAQHLLRRVHAKVARVGMPGCNHGGAGHVNADTSLGVMICSLLCVRSLKLPKCDKCHKATPETVSLKMAEKWLKSGAIK